MSFLTGMLLWIEPHLPEIAATLFSCFGAFTVARHGHSVKALIGWQSWLVAGVLWVSFAVLNGHWFMAITQTYFFVTAAQGLRNTLANCNPLRT